MNDMNERTSVSIPRELILEIDRERGDVSRSRYLLRILERSRVGYIDTNKCSHEDEARINQKDSVDLRTGIHQSTESLIT